MSNNLKELYRIAQDESNRPYVRALSALALLAYLRGDNGELKLIHDALTLEKERLLK